MEEELEIRYVWFCLLALADREGFVDMTMPAISRRINIHESVVKQAIEKFLLPDPSSRTPTEDGRRLEAIRESFGWRIINYLYYRDLRNEESRREYMKEYMRTKRSVNKKVNAANKNVNSKHSKLLLAKAEAEAEAEADLDTDLKAEEKAEKGAPPSHSLGNDQVWFEGLKKLPQYAHVDFDRELDAMFNWLAGPKNIYNRTFTQQFVTGWLKRVEKPMQLNRPPKQEGSSWLRKKLAEEAAKGVAQ